MKKSLSAELEEAKKNEMYYRGKYEEAIRSLSEIKQANETKYRDTMNTVIDQGHQVVSLGQSLMEVIRWHVNPETAKKAYSTFCQRCGVFHSPENGCR